MIYITSVHPGRIYSSCLIYNEDLVNINYKNLKINQIQKVDSTSLAFPNILCTVNQDLSLRLWLINYENLEENLLNPILILDGHSGKHTWFVSTNQNSLLLVFYLV
jgi:hypothetical protein